MTKKILIVEDNENVRKSLANAIRRRGFEVVEAANGESAVVVARRCQPDVILSDVDMEKGDGAFLQKTLRRDVALAEIPLIFMTGRTELPAALDGARSSKTAFLSKPFTLEELVGAIEQAIAKA